MKRGRKGPVSSGIHNNTSLPGKYSKAQSHTGFLLTWSLQAKAVGIYFSRLDWRRYTTVSTSWVNWPLCVKLVAFPFNLSHDVVLMCERVCSLFWPRQRNNLIWFWCFYIMWRSLIITAAEICGKYSSWTQNTGALQPAVCRNCLHVRHSLCRLLKSCFCLQIKRFLCKEMTIQRLSLCVLKEQFTKEWELIHYLRWSFIVHKTFLDPHCKILLEHSAKQVKQLETRFEMEKQPNIQNVSLRARINLKRRYLLLTCWNEQ